MWCLFLYFRISAVTMDFFVVYMFYNKFTLCLPRSLWKLVHIFGTLTFLFSGTTRKLMSSTAMEVETRQLYEREKLEIREEG